MNGKFVKNIGINKYEQEINRSGVETIKPKGSSLLPFLQELC